MITNKKRFIAFVTAAAMVVTMAFSVIFVVHEAKHECHGVDCHICTVIGNCLNVFKDTTPKPEVNAIAAAFLFATVMVIGAVSAGCFVPSLIDLKVKLSN